jgi:hypothetical protein
MIYLNSIILFNYSPIIKVFMDFILSQCMLYIAFFDL